MGLLTLVIFFALSFCVKQSFAADPEFPTITGNFSGSGTVQAEGKVFHISFWFSDTLRSIRQDLKTYGQRRSRLVLETNGKYGTQVIINAEFGKEKCTYTKGTAKKPVKYESLFDFKEQPKYIGTETENGVEMQKWQYDDKKENVIYIRKDENGAVPVRIVNLSLGGVAMNIETFKNMPATIFSYNYKKCKKTPKN